MDETTYRMAMQRVRQIVNRLNVVLMDLSPEQDVSAGHVGVALYAARELETIVNKAHDDARNTTRETRRAKGE